MVERRQSLFEEKKMFRLGMLSLASLLWACEADKSADNDGDGKDDILIYAPASRV